MMSLDDLKNYLGIPLGDTTWDTFLSQQEAVVSDAIERYCGRKFNKMDYTQTMYKDDYSPRKEVQLYGYPITALTEITIDGEVQDLTKIRVQNEVGNIASPCGFFNPYQGCTYVFKYAAGYDPLPPTIIYVLTSIIGENLNKKKAGIDLNFGKDVQRVSIPGTIAIDYDYSLQNNEESTLMGAILGNYLNVLVAYKSERVIVGSGKVAYLA